MGRELSADTPRKVSEYPAVRFKVSLVFDRYHPTTGYLQENETREWDIHAKDAEEAKMLCVDALEHDEKSAFGVRDIVAVQID